jgi:hypothetical protein
LTITAAPAAHLPFTIKVRLATGIAPAMGCGVNRSASVKHISEDVAGVTMESETAGLATSIFAPPVPVEAVEPCVVAAILNFLF